MKTTDQHDSTKEQRVSRSQPGDTLPVEDNADQQGNARSCYNQILLAKSLHTSGDPPSVTADPWLPLPVSSHVPEQRARDGWGY